MLADTLQVISSSQMTINSTCRRITHCQQQLNTHRNRYSRKSNLHRGHIHICNPKPFQAVAQFHLISQKTYLGMITALKPKRYLYRMFIRCLRMFKLPTRASVTNSTNCVTCLRRKMKTKKPLIRNVTAVCIGQIQVNGTCKATRSCTKKQWTNENGTSNTLRRRNRARASMVTNLSLSPRVQTFRHR